MSRQVKQGDGWRVGWDPEAPVFQALLAGDCWSIELTAAELNQFCRLAKQLAETMAQMSNQLMESEKIACEVEGDLIWLEAEGYADAFALRFILLGRRRAEGGWPVKVVPQLLQALTGLEVF